MRDDGSLDGLSQALVVLLLLGAALIVLKLSGVIAWSWWAVTAPFWGQCAFFGGMYLFGLYLERRDARRS